MHGTAQDTKHFPYRSCGDYTCLTCTGPLQKIRIAPFLSRTQFSAKSTSPMIGSYGYPKVNVGVLSAVEGSAWKHDSPRYWSKSSQSIDEILNFRRALIHSYNTQKTRLVDATQEIAMAASPVEVDINLERAPRYVLSSDEKIAPLGPHASVRSIEITSHPRIPATVDKAVSDTDMLAKDAITYLHRHSIDEYHLTSLLSAGTLGRERRLVPTKWAITATDDTIGREITGRIRDYPFYDEYSFQFGGYLGNYFIVLLLPDNWGYELFEARIMECTTTVQTYATDCEGYHGRKSYAEHCAGGYYASRLPALRYLQKSKRQASVVSMRMITDEYTVPLGVWVVREAARKALQSRPLHFTSMNLLKSYTTTFIRQKFGCDVGEMLSRSRLIHLHQSQSKLTAFQ